MKAKQPGRIGRYEVARPVAEQQVCLARLSGSARNQRPGVLPQACIVILLALLLNLPDAAAAQSVIHPFVAEGRLLTQGFRTDTNLNYRTDASVVFIYSNGWWRVHARYSYLNLARGITNVADCMRIPDGTRCYMNFEGSTNKGLTTVANAFPIAFPPPGKTELLIPWLALCPQPELPLIDGKRMRRFSLPDYRPRIFNAPQNEGLYVARYLAPESAFLSELLVTNTGFGIELNVDNNSLEDEGRILRYAAPFQNGFTELQYNVIESTNLHSFNFPIRAVCRRFIPNWGGKDREDLRIGLQSELTLTKISFSEKDVASRIAAPHEMFAEDARPGVSVSYLVHDDQWKPVSDPEIARRARIARQRMGDSE